MNTTVANFLTSWWLDSGRWWVLYGVLLFNICQLLKLALDFSFMLGEVKGLASCR